MSKKHRQTPAEPKAPPILKLNTEPGDRFCAIIVRQKDQSIEVHAPNFLHNDVIYAAKYFTEWAERIMSTETKFPMQLTDTPAHSGAPLNG